MIFLQAKQKKDSVYSRDDTHTYVQFDINDMQIRIFYGEYFDWVGVSNLDNSSIIFPTICAWMYILGVPKSLPDLLLWFIWISMDTLYNL